MTTEYRGPEHYIFATPPDGMEPEQCETCHGKGEVHGQSEASNMFLYDCPDCKAPHCVELTIRQINLIVYALKDAAYNCERKNAEWKNNRPDLAELAKEHHQLADFLFALKP